MYNLSNISTEAASLLILAKKLEEESKRENNPRYAANFLHDYSNRCVENAFVTESQRKI